MLATQLLDPRPDLSPDHDEWERLLGIASSTYGHMARNSPYTELCEMRSGGARLERTRFGLRLTEGDWEPLEWYVRQETMDGRCRMDIDALLRTQIAAPADALPDEAPPLESIRTLAEARGWPKLDLFMARRLHALVVPAGEVLWQHFLGVATPEELRLAFDVLQEMPATSDD